ncbi:TfoX/Sxy family protein [Curvivirga aplysinae]|uniref:TfoX/Sxy family protein n=1 Tax=Curvivirga aplysinae TaxID=2529852 RepID=UPI0012BB557B|nr:TfoX/Sxy family protein [Curvivirga aplysinae]MTI10558.1 TfoX family protein [Curvivirga aplysinae]
MAAKPPEIVQYYREVFENLGPIESKRFFGGWDFRHMSVQFAVYLLNELYFVVDDDLREKLIEIGSHPFSYPKKGKVVSVERWYSVPDELLENPDELLPYAEQAFRVAPRK